MADILHHEYQVSYCLIRVCICVSVSVRRVHLPCSVFFRETLELLELQVYLEKRDWWVQRYVVDNSCGGRTIPKLTPFFLSAGGPWF